MGLIRIGSQPSSKRPDDCLTGQVRIIYLFQHRRTHWHGASPSIAMSPIATQEQMNEKIMNWMEKVSDEQYQKKRD